MVVSMKLSSHMVVPLYFLLLLVVTVYTQQPIKVSSSTVFLKKMWFPDNSNTCGVGKPCVSAAWSKMKHNFFLTNNMHSTSVQKFHGFTTKKGCKTTVKTSETT